MNETSLPSINISTKKQYLYVWLDILGFSDILDQEDRYIELIDLLKEFRKQFENLEYTAKTLTISDGIVLIFDMREIQDIQDLKNIFLKISEIQENFILDKGYFLRGGMAIGTIEDNEEDENLKYLISNALSKAYNLESKFVKYPIIATNEEELKKINDHFLINSDDLERFGLFRCHSIQSSKSNKKYIYFIDFMNNDKFKDIIKINLDRYQSSPKILEKYIWLHRYVNDKFVIDEDNSLSGIII